MREESPSQAGRPPGTGQAPGRLELVRGFVNTRDIEEGTDELGSAEALAGWLAARGLLGERPGAPSARDLRTAVALRESLREVLLSHAGRPCGGAAAAAELSSIARAMPVRLEVDAAGAIRPAAAGTGIAAALAALLLIAAEARAEGTWARLKVCAADDCRWAFYDRSPARTGCWCSMAVCGARAKSRAYRRRARTASAQYQAAGADRAG